MLAYKHLTIEQAGLKIEEPAAEKAGAPFTVSGYGSTFGGEPDSYGDIIAEGAYTETLKAWNSGKRGPLQIFWNHNPDQVIGKWVGLAEDRKGLLVTGELTPGHAKAADVVASLKHGAVSGLSIGYRPKKITKLANGVNQLDEIELRELSIVTRPANVNARILALKGLEEAGTVREFEAMLHDCGLSRREAEALCAGGFKALVKLRDGVGQGDPADARRDDDKAAERDGLDLLAELRGVRPLLGKAA